MTLARLVAPLRRRTADPVALAGVVLLAAALGVQALFVTPLAAARESLVAQQQAAQAERQARGGPLGRRPADAAERLTRFRALFPPAESAPRWLEVIDAAATREGLELVSGEYRLEHRAEDRLARYRMSLPVSGSYAQIRRFMGQVLKDVPTAAIDDVQLQRDSGPGRRLTATLRLSLYVDMGAAR